MASYAVKTNRRRFTITTIVSIVSVVALVLGIFAIFGKSPSTTSQNAVIGSKIDKTLGGGASASKC